MQHDAFQLGDWRVEPATGRLWRGADELQLQNKTMELLCFLAERAGQVLSLDEIMAGVWGDTVVSDNVIYWNINQLRTALGQGGDDSPCIETLPRRGYRLLAQVSAPGPGQAGERPFRLLRSSLVVVAVLAAAVLAWYYRQPSSLAEPPTLAVLPFVNMSGDAADESFADGVTEELLNTVAQFQGLHVIGRTSSFYYKNHNVDLREVGKSLGADHIVEGSVRRSKDRVRITVQLIDAGNGHHRWSQTYDRRVADLLDVQRDVALQVAEALNVQLTTTQVASLRSDAGTDAGARELLDQARALLRRGGGAESQQQVIGLLKQALDRDPDNFEALSMLGTAYAILRSVFSYPFEDSVAPARDILNRMSRAGFEQTADYQFVNALVTRHEMSAWGVTPERIAAIDRAYERALELNSNHVEYYLSYAIHARRLGELEKCAGLLDQAALLDPLDLGVNLQYARVLGATGRTEEALNRAHALVRHYPESALAYSTLGETLAHQGRFGEALEWLQRAPLNPGNNLLMYQLRMTSFAMGDRDRAVDWIYRSDVTPEEEALITGIRGDWGAASQELGRLLRNDPAPESWALVWGGDAALLAGRMEAARYFYESAAPGLVEDRVVVHPQNYRTALKLAAVLQALGETRRANELLAELDAWLSGHHALGFEGHATSRAEVFALQGRKAEAIAELTALFEAGWEQLFGPWPDCWYGQLSPLLASLEGESGWAELQRRAGERLAEMRAAVTAGS